MRDKSIALVIVAMILVAIGALTVILERRSRMPVLDRSNLPPNELPPEAKKVLETGERFVLLAVQPLPDEPTPPPEGVAEPPIQEKFHGYPILGKVEIQGQKERADLLHALYKDMEGAYGFAPCFYPRHGISATHGDDTVDLVICFECGVIEVYTNHGNVALAVSDSPESPSERALTKALSRANLNQHGQTP